MPAKKSARDRRIDELERKLEDLWVAFLQAQRRTNLMYAIKDWFMRNRAKIGGVLSTIGAGVATIDPALIQAHPRLSAYVVLGFGIVFGGGAFKSDGYQRDKQGL